MARQSSLPLSLAPIGVTRDVAAAFVSLSPGKFQELVERGVMPKPKRADGRLIWDGRRSGPLSKRCHPTRTTRTTRRGTMPRRLPPFVELWRDRHGKVRVYFRRGKGARVALPSVIGSDEFEEAYAAALAGQVAAKRARREPDQPGTIGALISSYFRSASYVELRDTTKAGYRSRMEALRAAHGHRTVNGLNRERIVTRILQPYVGKPGAALDTLKKLRILIRHAILLNWLNHDPSIGIKRPKTTEIRSWTDAEIAQFENRWPVGTKERLAFALHLFTGQRGSDVCRMTWADVHGSTIDVVPQKDRVKRKLTIPLHPELKAALDASPRRQIVMIATDYGKAFSRAGFGNFMREAITSAGLPLDCQPHGIRKAAGRRLADVECSAHQIMAVLGHTTLAEAERYTRQADQARLARSAVARLPVRSGNKVAQPEPKKVGKIQKAMEIQNDGQPRGAP